MKSQKQLKKPRILIMMPCWSRVKITRLVLINMMDVIQRVKQKVDVSVLCVLSPEDPQYRHLLKMISTQENVRVILFENYPLGRKHNAGVNYALEEMEFDYLMNMGSDDLVHPYLFDFYLPHIEKKELFFGINNLYFVHTATSKTILYRTYNDHRAIGAGRMIHYKVLKEMKRNYVNLYQDDFNRGLDCSSSNRIKEEVKVEETVLDAGSFPYIVDLKSNTNINDFGVFEGYNKRIQVISRDYLKKFFPVLNPSMVK